MSSESSQKKVNIDANVKVKIEEWLETPEAKALGFNSLARFMTIAGSELLTKHKKKRFEHFNFADNIIRLIDNNQPKGTPYIEIALNNSDLICRVCESKNCIHIAEAWNNKNIAKQMKRKGLKNKL